MILWDEAMFRKWYADTVRPPLPNPRTKVTYGRLYARNWLWDVVAWNEAATWPDSDLRGGYQPPDSPLNEWRKRVERLVANFPILPSSRILVLGCGFGFLPETFRSLGYPNAWGVDNSAFIQAGLSGEATVPVLNRDFRTNNNQMKNALTTMSGGSTYDFVITESVIESYTTAERTAVLDASSSYLSPGTPLANVIHVVFPGWDASADGGSPGLSLDEWAATRPAHSWASPEGDWLVRTGV